MAENLFLKSPNASATSTGLTAPPVPSFDFINNTPSAPDAAPPSAAASLAQGMLPPPDLQPLFEKASADWGVPINVLSALAQQESNYNANAVGSKTKWGRAKGMLQYIDPTAKGMGIDPFNAQQSINAAAQQFKERLDKGYSVQEAVAAHFGGDDRAQWGPKTKKYVEEVLGKAGAIDQEMMATRVLGEAQAKPDIAALQAQADAEEPGRYKVLTPEEAERYQKRIDLTSGKGARQDAQKALGAYDAPSPYPVDTQARIEDQVNAMQPPSPLTITNQDRLRAGVAPKEDLPPDGFLSATGKALANVPEHFKNAAGGLLASFGERVDDQTLVANAQNAGIIDRLKDNGTITMVQDERGNFTPTLPDGKPGDVSAVAAYIRQNAGELMTTQEAGKLLGMKPNEVAKYGRQLSKEARRDELKVNPDGPLAKYGSMIIGSTTEMIPAILAGVVTKNPNVAMGLIGGQVYGQSYDQGRQGKLNPQDAATYALMQAAAEAIPERLPLHFILKPGQNFFKGVLAAGAAEAAQEAVTQAIQSGLDKGSINPNMTWAEARQAMADAMIVGAGSGAALRAGVHGIQKGLDAIPSRDREAEAAAAAAAQGQPAPAAAAPTGAPAPNPAPTPSAQPAPAPAPGGTLTNAAAKVTQTPGANRVTVQTPAGPVAGTLEAFTPGQKPGEWDARVLSDDGQFYQYTDKDGVTITPDDQEIPTLTDVVEDDIPTLTDIVDDQIPTLTDVVSPGVEIPTLTDVVSPGVEIPTLTEVVPTLDDVVTPEDTPDYTAMDEQQLRAELKKTATAIKEQPKNASLREQRKAIEKAINTVVNKVLPPAKDYSSYAKAQGAMFGKGLTDTHEVINVNGRFEIREKPKKRDPEELARENAAVREQIAKKGAFPGGTDQLAPPADFPKGFEAPASPELVEKAKPAPKAKTKAKDKPQAEPEKKWPDTYVKRERKEVAPTSPPVTPESLKDLTDKQVTDGLMSWYERIGRWDDKREGGDMPAQYYQDRAQHMAELNRRRTQEQVDRDKRALAKRLKGSDNHTGYTYAKIGDDMYAVPIHKDASNGTRLDLTPEEQAAVKKWTDYAESTRGVDNIDLDDMHARAAEYQDALRPAIERAVEITKPNGKAETSTFKEPTRAEKEADPYWRQKLTPEQFKAVNKAETRQHLERLQRDESEKVAKLAKLKRDGASKADIAVAQKEANDAVKDTQNFTKRFSVTLGLTEPEAKPTPEFKAPKVEPTNSLSRTASWVIRDKATGDVIMETFDQKKVDALNTSKYEAVPIAEHLASLNKPQAKPAATTEKPLTPQQRAKVRKENRRKASRDAMDGIKEGDQFIPSIDVGYTTAGQTYTVESIDSQGNVFVKRSGTSSGTSLSFAELIGAQRKGVTYTKVEAEKPASKAPKEAIPDVVATPAANASEYGANNKLVTRDRAAELKAKLQAKLNGSQLNSGLDPEILAMGTELAVFHLEAGVRKFADFAKTMADDLGQPLAKIRPFLRGWYNGARDLMEDGGVSIAGMDDANAVREQLATLDADLSYTPTDNQGENANAASSSQRVERDRGQPDGAKPVDAVAVSDEPAGTRRSPREPGPSANESREVGQRDQRVPTDGAVAGRERGNQRVHQPDGEFRPSSGDARGADGARSRSDREPGSAVEQERAEHVAESAPAADTSEFAQRLKAQKKAAGTKTVRGDKANIDAALPLLLDPQREDVLKAEQRFAVGNGILLTNGTGTGKTASGMGVIVRSINAGKPNALVIVPSDKIAADWIKFAKMLGVDLKMLDSTNDNGGTGPVITTYANFGANDTLALRDWDQFVADEAHYLSSNEKGEGTSALSQLHALSGHHAGFYRWVRERNYKEWGTYKAAMNASRDAANPDSGVTEAQKEKLADAEAVEKAKWDAIEEPAKKAWADRWAKQKDLPKTLFLSATPFAYVKSVDYAEGYLFDYTDPAERGSNRAEMEGYSYNSGDAREKFFMQHFGYRMRYNKLTQPEAGVDSELMEQNFNQHLKETGALSGRRLEVPFDYDRKFVMVDDAVGQKIDKGLEYLREHDEGKYRKVYDAVMKSFDYHRRMYLLESIKARAVVPMIKAHMKLGRKVVVFHDFNKGGGFDPFKSALRSIADSEVRDMATEAYAARPDIFSKMDLTGLYSPIDTLSAAFPDALFFNGTVPKAQRRANADTFNDDNSGKNLIVLQSDAGREGVSLHDTTAKHMRVLINLGMPGKPVAAIQIEGRTYRTGQASDAAFRYLTTGTAWETSAFAHKIAERASTAENLALGTEARGLKQSFIDAYNEADVLEPSAEDGKGGKALDRDLAATATLSPFNKARAYYFAQQKNSKRRDQREGVDYFATPEPVGFKMVEWANIQKGDNVLEPSAGHGAIARFMPPQSNITMIEPSYNLSQRAALANGTARIINDTFESLHLSNKYDAIVMNPPYGSGGKTAIDHVAKAAKHLREGGRIVALIPRGGMADKRLAAYLESDDARDLFRVASIDMPASTFERAGTSVNTQIIVLEKHSNADDASNVYERSPISLANVESTAELFDRIEHLDLPDRVPVSQPEPEPAPVVQPVEGLIEHTTAKGKVLKGIVRTDLTKAEAKAIDNFTFAKDGGWFIREKHLGGSKASVASDIAGEPASLQQVNDAITQGEFGPVVAKLIEAGQVVVHDTAQSLPAETGKVAGIQAVTTADGTVHLVAANLTPATANAVLLHEMFHSGAKALLGTQRWNTLIKRLDALHRQAEQSTGKARSVYDKAAERVAKAQAQGAVAEGMSTEEFGAYAIEEYEQLPTAFRKWADDLLGAVKHWILNRFGAQLGKVTPAQLRALAKDVMLSNATQQRSAAAFSAGTPEIVATPAFKRWFGKSKVVDANGQPKVMYHGSRYSGISQFDAVGGGATFFSPDPAVAGRYTGELPTGGQYANQPTIYPVYLRAENPFDFEIPAHVEALTDALYGQGMTMAKLTGYPLTRIRTKATGWVDDEHGGYWQYAPDLSAPARRFSRKEFIQRAKQGDWGMFETREVQAALKSLGHDGYHTFEHEAKNLAIYTPEQIKSAVGNSGAFDPASPDIRYSVLPNDTALADATRALDNPEQLKPDFIGQLSQDIGRIARFVLHPRQIAALHKGFTPVYRTAISQFEMRDALIDELQQHHKAYDELSQESKTRVNSVLELGRLYSTTYPEKALKDGIAHSGEKTVVRLDENGKTTRVKEPVKALLSQPGEVIKLDPAEIEAYNGLRSMFDEALDKFKDQTLTDFGYPELAGTKKAAAAVMAKITPATPAAVRDRLEGVARFIEEIEQAKRTGYVPFARYGDYVVAVKEQQFPLKLIKDPTNGGWITRDLPKVYDDFVSSMGAKYDNTEDGYRLDEEQRKALIAENERTVHSSKVEFTLRDKLLIKRGRKVEDLPSVKKALIEAEKHKEGKANRRVVAFETIQKKPEGGVKLSDVDALAEVAMLDTETWDAVREQLQDAIKGRSFRKHFFQSDNVPGYTGDFERAIADYMAGMSGYLSRRHFNQAWDNAVAKIKAPRLFEYATKYRAYANEPHEELAMVRQVGFFSYIAGVPATAFANLTQPLLLTMPVLGQIAPQHLVIREMARAYKDALAMARINKTTGLDFFDPNAAPADLRDVLREAWAEGMFVPLQTYEVMATAQTSSAKGRKATRVANKVVQATASLFSFAERLNRLVTFIASARLATRPAVKANMMKVYSKNALARSSLSTWSPKALGEFMIDETQFRMGKANRPVISRGLGAALMQFKGFVMQSLETWFRLASQNGTKGLKAAALSIGTMALIGGLWGMPGADDLRDVIEKVYKQVTKQDLDLKTEVRQQLYELTGERWISEVASKGATYPFGLDLSRIGMGNIAPDSPLQVFGIPADLFVGRPTRAFAQASQGNALGAAGEFLPNFLKNPITAYGWGQNGVRDGAGRLSIKADEIGGGEMLSKSLGFQPPQVTNVRDYEYAQRRMETANDLLKRSYLDKIARSVARAEKHPDQAAEAQAELAEINQKLKEHNDQAAPEQQIILGRSALKNRISREMGGVEQTWGRERKQARGASDAMRDAFGLSKTP